jgi:hypothetical protein
MIATIAFEHQRLPLDHGDHNDHSSYIVIISLRLAYQSCGLSARDYLKQVAFITHTLLPPFRYFLLCHLIHFITSIGTNGTLIWKQGGCGTPESGLELLSENC